jgi:hypothetical protein
MHDSCFEIRTDLKKQKPHEFMFDSTVKKLILNRLILDSN